MVKRRVLFLCTGNSARSQMAEGLLRHLAGEWFEVHSAGLHPRPVHPLAVEAMKEIGIDIRHQRSKGVEDVKAVGKFFFLIIVCANAEAGCPETFKPALVRLFWPFDDPSRTFDFSVSPLQNFRRVRDEIRARIEIWLREELPCDWLLRNDNDWRLQGRNVTESRWTESARGGWVSTRTTVGWAPPGGRTNLHLFALRIRFDACPIEALIL